MAERSVRHPGFSLRMVLLILLLVLAWRVLSLGMADAQSRNEPEQALQWRASHSVALFLLAEKQAKNASSQDEARKNALAALSAYPFEGRAYRVLGQLAEAQNESGKALQFFQKAAYYSPRDLESRAWLLNHSLQNGRADAAVLHLDILLRIQIDLLPQLVPTIAGLAVNPGSQNALIDCFRKQPAWRIRAINALVSQDGAAERYAVFFNRLANTKEGMSASEQQAWLSALNRGRQWPLAYLNWATQLSLEQQGELGNLFNGSFEHEPLGGEFDWQFDHIPGATIDRVFRDGVLGDKALRISFADRRVPFNSVRQTLVLPAGRYRMSGQAYLEDLRTDLGLVWSVRCIQAATDLATSTPWKGDNKVWLPFSMDFEVPTSECPAQSLLLKLPARVESEQEIGGTIWFDGLRIQKIQGLTEQIPN